MAAMGVVQVATNQVIDVVPVGYGLVPTVCAMDMRLVMTRTVVAWRTLLRIGRVDLDAMLVHYIAVRMVQVAIVKIVNVAIVLDSRMATVWAVLVAVSTGMLPMSLRHALILSQCGVRPTLSRTSRSMAVLDSCTRPKIH